MCVTQPAQGGSAPNLIRPLSLRGNFAWSTCGNIIYSFCSWVMLAVVSKLGDPALVGQFSLGLAVTQPILAFSQLNLSQIQMTDARREFRFGDYLGLRLLTNAVALVVLAAVAWTGGHARETALIIFIVGVGAAFDALGDVTFGILRQHERMDRVAISMAAGGVLSLAGLAGGLALTHSIVGAAAGSALASALVALGYDVPNAVFVLRASGRDPREALVPLGHLRLPRPHWDRGVLIRLTVTALPLGTVMLLIALNNNIARYFIERFEGERALGLFSALASFVAVGRVVTMALGMAASPRLSRHYADGDRGAFARLTARLILLGALLGVAAPLAGLVAGRWVLSRFYTPEYAGRMDVFVLLLAAGGVGYVAGFVGWAITAARYLRVQTLAQFAVTVVTVATCAWLVPTHGLSGAAWSAILASATQLVVNLLILRRALGAPIPAQAEASAA